MDQIVHIFRKDVRRHWREILLSLGILALFAWNEPSKWMPRPSRESIFRAMFSGWLAPMVAISWLFLILRVVHEESLTGDRQFWVTRPYQWKKLLTAKALFLVTFINVPLFGAQVFLLWKAGFASSRFMTGLLWVQLMWILILIVPMTTLATVTSSFGQTVLVVLGILLSLMGLAALTSEIPNPGISILRWIPEWLPLSILLGVFTVVLVWQYARRKTLQSRLLLIGAAAAILVIMEETPPRAFTAQAFQQPSAGQQLPVQLSFDPAKPSTAEGAPMKDKVQIRIPLLVSGIAQNSAVSIDGIMIDIEAPGGLHWNSGWNRSFSELLPAQPTTETHFGVDKAFFEQVKSTLAKVHISFALSAFVPTEVRRVAAMADAFAVPGGALCALYPENRYLLQCRSPLKTQFLVVSTQSEETTCLSAGNAKTIPPRTVFYAWNWSRDSAPALLALSPVELFDFRFSHWPRMSEDLPASLCTGTPLTFSILKEGQHTRSELTIDGLRLDDYQLMDVRQYATGIGVAIP
jgi:hypothetical protein